MRLLFRWMVMFVVTVSGDDNYHARGDLYRGCYLSILLITQLMVEC